MADKLHPGSHAALQPGADAAWADTMAAAIDAELNALLAADGLPQLPTDSQDREVQDRRRLFVAIARGVVRHLHDNAAAFRVTVDAVAGPQSVEPAIGWEPQ